MATGAGSAAIPLRSLEVSLINQTSLPAITRLLLRCSNTLSVGVGEKLFTYVYLDPANPPTEIMLQFMDANGWEHRAYWGANAIDLGTNGTNSRRYIGPLPATGQWVRLEIPANLVGLEGSAINGVAYTLFDGRATWDKTGKVAATTGSFKAVPDATGNSKATAMVREGKRLFLEFWLFAQRTAI